MRTLKESKNRLYDIIDTLCKENGTSIAELCRKQDLRPGLFSDLKSRERASLSMDNLRKIADHLQVSMDVLFDRGA